jgi:hypothetical protein
MDPVTWLVLWVLVATSLVFLGAVVRSIWRDLLTKYRERHHQA